MEAIREHSPISSPSSQTLTFRSCSSTIPKQNVILIKKPKGLFPSDFFSMFERRDSSAQHKSQPNQPLLPTCISIAPITPHPRPLCEGKIVVDIQKELDEDKELLDLLGGKEGLIKERAGKCEIIPEVDEDKMKTMSLMSQSKAFNLNEGSEALTHHDSNAYNFQFTRRGLKLSKRRKEVAVNEPLEQVNRIIKRFNSGNSKKGLNVLNPLVLPLLGSSLKSKKSNDKAASHTKQSLIYASQERIDEEELTSTSNKAYAERGKHLNEASKRSKVCSAPNQISKHPAQPSPSLQADSNNTTDNAKGRKINQLAKSKIIRHRYNSNIQLRNFLTSNIKSQHKSESDQYAQLSNKNQTPYQRNHRGLFMRINPQHLLGDSLTKDKDQLK